MIAVLATFVAFGKPSSTRWEGGGSKHPHGVGFKCPYCDQTWDAIPKGIKAWEKRHLKQALWKCYLLHLRLSHGIIMK